MIDRKSLLRHLGSEPAAILDAAALTAALTRHFKSVGWSEGGEKPIAARTERAEALEECARIGLTGEGGAWCGYYAKSPDFFGVSNAQALEEHGELGPREDGDVRGARVGPRRLLGIVAQLGDDEIARHGEFCESLQAIDAAGCAEFWVGRSGVVALTAPAAA